jgi:hypothetical protein
MTNKYQTLFDLGSKALDTLASLVGHEDAVNPDGKLLDGASRVKSDMESYTHSSASLYYKKSKSDFFESATISTNLKLPQIIRVEGDSHIFRSALYLRRYRMP